MSLLYKLFHEFISHLNQQQHPLVLLNHSFHGTENISYKKEVEEPIKARFEILTSDNIEKINEIYHLYVQDVALLREAFKHNTLPGVDVNKRHDYLEKLNIIATTLEQGESLFDRPKAIQSIHHEFKALLYDIAHDAAWERYKTLYHSAANKVFADESDFVQRITGIVEKAIEVSGPQSNPQKNEVIEVIAEIKKWQDDYEQLPLAEAALITQLLNSETNKTFEGAFVRSTVASSNTFEYRLADLYDILCDKSLELDAINHAEAEVEESVPFQLEFIPKNTTQSDGFDEEDEDYREEDEEEREPDSDLSSEHTDLEEDEYSVSDLASEDTDLEEDEYSVSDLSSEHTTNTKKPVLKDEAYVGLGLEPEELNHLVFKYLSKHLYEKLDEQNNLKVFGELVECRVKPVVGLQHQSDIDSFPGLQARSAGSIWLSDRAADDYSERESVVSGFTDYSEMSTDFPLSVKGEVAYTEYVDSLGKIALINNKVSGNISSSEMNTILTEQASYLKKTESQKNLADDFVFRLEFKSQQQFEDYQANGKLRDMLKDFATQHPDFKIKVVIKSTATEKEAIKRYASFNDLFGNAQAGLKKKSPLIASIEKPGIIGSTLNVRSK